MKDIMKDIWLFNILEKVSNLNMDIETAMKKINKEINKEIIVTVKEGVVFCDDERVVITDRWFEDGKIINPEKL